MLENLSFFLSAVVFHLPYSDSQHIATSFRPLMLSADTCAEDKSCDL